MSTDPAPTMSPLDRLQAAVQAFVNETSDEPVFVGSALLVWEGITYTSTGSALFDLDFASCGAQESMTSALGLSCYAQAKMTDDLVHGTGDD